MKHFYIKLNSKKCTLFSGIVGAIFLFSACVINPGETDELPVPQVSNTATTYTISFSPIQNMKYANIIRQKTIYSNAEEDDDDLFESENIGQIFPADENKLPNTFMFSDPLTDKSCYYRYYVRYFNGEDYFSSSKTKIVQGLNDSVDTGVTIPDGTTVTYVKNEKLSVFQLVISPADKTSSITIPDGFDELAIVLNNGTNTRPFIIPLDEDSDTSTDSSTNTGTSDGSSGSDTSTGSDDSGGSTSADTDTTTTTDTATTSDTTKSVTLPSGTTYDLQKNLPDDFMDKELSFVGLIFVTTETESAEKSYNYYYWSKLLTANFTVNHTPANSDDTADSTFIVPSTVRNDNNLDFSLSRAPRLLFE